jgi:hypothetical protein
MDPYRSRDDSDLDNPYAAPQSAFAPEPGPSLISTARFGINDVFNWSWSIFRERMSSCMMIIWGAAGINIALSMGLNLLQVVLTATVNDRLFAMVIYCGAAICSFVLQIWIVWIGASLAVLKIARGEPVAFQDIFTGGRYVLTMILSSIIFSLVLAGPIALAVGLITATMVAMGPQSAGGIIAFVLGSSLAAVMVVYVSSRLAMYYYLVIDRDAGVIGSLRQSWLLCKNRVGMIVMVVCLQMAIALAGILALCVGLIWAVPLASLVMPVTYLAMTGRKEAPGDKPEVIWEEDL